MATTFLEFIARPRKLLFACGNTFYAESVERPNASFLDDHRRNSVVTPLAAVRGSPGPERQNSLDAVLVGYYEGDALQFAGKVRAGLVPFVRREVLAKLKPLRVPRCLGNLSDPSPGRWGSGVPAEEMAKMQWTKPEVVAQIRFVEWTADNRLRHAAFLGLRDDKSAREVQRES
jgi:ATP-dependent DNA ligase